MAGANKQIAILGGGLTGLALAHSLKRKGHHVSVFEASPRLGGWIHTERHKGFLLERGPNTLLSSPEVQELIQELNLEPLVDWPLSSAKKRFLLHRGSGDSEVQLQAAPLSLIQTISNPLLSTKGKLRALAEPWHCKRGVSSDRSVESFFSERFGDEVSRNLIAAVVGGIYAGNHKELSLEYCFPGLFDLGSSSLLFSGLRKFLRRGRVKERQKKSAPRRIMSFQGGLITLIEALTKSLEPGSVHLNTKISQILVTGTDSQRIYHLAEHGPFDHVFVTTPAAASAELIAHLPSQGGKTLSEEVRRIPHASVGVLQVAIKKSAVPYPLDGFGVLIPPHLSKGLLGIIFPSSLFAGRAPEDTHLLTCISGGANFPERAQLDTPAGRQEILQELKSTLRLQGTPEVLQHSTLIEAIPNYAVHHGQLVKKISALEAEFPGLQFVTQWRQGIGLPDRIRFARAAARSVPVTVKGNLGEK